jgi:multidrug efflux pump subunit AcrB
MLASYVLSRTLVPTLSRMMLGGEPVHDAVGIDTGDGVAHPPAATGFWHWFNTGRDQYFARFQNAYARALTALIKHPWFTLATFTLILLTSLALFPVIGQDFFPSTDAGIMKLHFRAPSGTRIEHTEQLVAQVEQRIRRIIPPAELSTINATIGIPGSLNLAFVPTNNASGMDAEILIALNPEHHPTAGYVHQIRTALSAEFPGSTVYFQTADIVGQVLNFGLPAPIDVQIQGQDLDRSYAVARTLRDKIREVPGAADVTIKQVLDYPTLHLDIDRQRAAELGITQRDAANSMLISLASSGLVSPSYFVNPANQVSYLVAVEVPLVHMNSTQDVLSTPVTSGGHLMETVPAWAATNPMPRAPTQTLQNIARMTTTAGPAEIDHYTVERVLDVLTNVEGRDLGSVVSGGRGDEPCLQQPRAGAHRRGPPGVRADGRAVPIVDRPADHHGRRTGRDRRDLVDARADAHHDQHRVAARRHHGRRDRGRQLDSRGQLRE